MAGNAYPHIVFAKDPEVLPMQTLTEVLAELYPEAQIHQGAIKAVLQLGAYAFTFWYDEEADGLGERYADYAAPLKRKRITRCSVMIDASGDVDEDGSHASDAARIMGALAQREGVYVFSEETKRFLGMDYEDGESTPLQPELDPRSEVSPAAHADADSREVVLGHEEVSGEFAHTEERPVDRFNEPAAAATYTSGPIDPTPVEEPAVRVDTVPSAPVAPEPVHAEPVVVERVEPVETPAPAVAEPTPAPTAPVEESRDVLVTGAPTPTPEVVEAPTTATTPAAQGAPVEPARPTTAAPAEEKDKPGLLKRLFGRKR